MYLIVQIPCYNEEKSILKVVNSIPKKLKGIKKIDILIIDDGSSDNTHKIINSRIKKDFYIRLPVNKGLANAFKIGINKCLEKKADLIVNLDGDNQYKASDIQSLIDPIIINNYDFTIGERRFKNIKTFSFIKKFLQIFGSLVVSKIVKFNIKDATSGFRAYNRKTASKIFVYNNFTYTIESLMHFSNTKLSFKGIPIDVNQKERESRLFKSNFEYIFKTFCIILRVFFLKYPFKLMTFLSIIFLVPGLYLCINWINLWYLNLYDFNLTPSLLLGTMLITLSILSLAIALLCYYQSVNKNLQEEIISILKTNGS